MRKIISYILLTFPILCSSQIPTTRFNIKTSPLSVVDYVRPSIQLGIENYLNKNYSFSLTFSQNINDYRRDEYSYYKNGFRTNTEIRYYPDKWIKYFFKSDRDSISSNRHFRVKKTYIACELFYMHTYMTRPATYVYDILYYNDTYPGDVHINKQSIGFTFKTGWSSYYKNFIIDLFVGVGSRYKLINYESNNPMPVPFLNILDESEGIFRQKWEGNFITPSISIGINIGYQIKTSR